MSWIGSWVASKVNMQLPIGAHPVKTHRRYFRLSPSCQESKAKTSKLHRYNWMTPPAEQLWLRSRPLIGRSVDRFRAPPICMSLGRALNEEIEYSPSRMSYCAEASVLLLWMKTYIDPSLSIKQVHILSVCYLMLQSTALDSEVRRVTQKRHSHAGSPFNTNMESSSATTSAAGMRAEQHCNCKEKVGVHDVLWISRIYKGRVVQEWWDGKPLMRSHVEKEAEKLSC